MPDFQSPDRELLRRIASQDREAFQQLYARYEKPAYNLALKMTRQTHLAEEALQAGMYRVWRYAGSCHDESARGWILKIVANEALRLLRIPRHREASSENLDHFQAARPQTSGTMDALEGLVHDEGHSALRKALDQLPTHQRQCLLLHYGAELSQREIGRALGVSQRSISTWIGESLEAVRKKLAGSGFAALAETIKSSPNPSGASELWAEIILAGTNAPETLGAKIMEQVNDPKFPVLNSQSSRSKWIVSLSFCVLLGTALFAALNPFDATEHEDPTTTKSSSASDEPAPRWIWHFEPGENQALLIALKGHWKLNTAGGYSGSGCLKASTDKGCTILIDLPKHDLPFEVRFKTIFSQSSHTYLGWKDQACVAWIPRRTHSFPLPRMNAWVAHTFRVSEKRIEQTINGSGTDMCLFEGQGTGQLVLRLGPAQRLDDLEILPLNVKELPGAEAIEGYFDSLPEGEHTGIVPLPNDFSPTEAQPLFMVFPPFQRSMLDPFKHRKPGLLDFNSPIDGIKFNVARGRWRHVRDRTGQAFMKTGPQGMYAVFTTPVAISCNHISLRVRPDEDQPIPNLEIGFPWGRRTGFFRKAFRPAPMPAGQWKRIDFYFSSGFLDVWVEGQRHSLAFMEPPWRKIGYLKLSGTGYAIDDFLFDHLPPNRFPKLDAYRKVLEGLPGEKRKGRVQIPEIPGTQQGESAHIEFLDEVWPDMP